MKYCLLLLSTLFVISSCQKVDTPANKEVKMREGKWKLDVDVNKGILKEYKWAEVDTTPVDTLYAMVGLDENKQPLKNRKLDDSTYIVHAFPECKKDDFFKFRENNNGALNTGAEKCPPGETEEIAIRYGFENNDTRFYIYNAGAIFLGNHNVVADVAEYSESRIVLKYMAVDNTSHIPAKDTFRHTLTLVKF